MYYSRQNKRGANFSQHERDVLIDCVQKYKHIIEDKRTDSKAIYKKQKAWARILVLYNTQLGVTKRAVKQLQSAWKNMKRQTKVFKEPKNVDGDRRIEDKRRENARVLSVLETSSNDLGNESDNSQVGDGQDSFYIETNDIDIKTEPVDEGYQLSNPLDFTSKPFENQANVNLSEPGISVSNESANSFLPKIQMVQTQAVPISNTQLNPKVQSSITSRLLAPKPPPTYQVILQPHQNGANLIQHLQPLVKKPKILSRRQKSSASAKTLSANKNTQIMTNSQPPYITLQALTGINQDSPISNQVQQVSPVLNNLPVVINQQLSNGNVSFNNTTPINQLPQIVHSDPLRSITSSQVTDRQNISHVSVSSNYSQQEHLEKMRTLKLERILMRREHKEKMAMYKAKREYYVEKKGKILSGSDSM